MVVEINDARTDAKFPVSITENTRIEYHETFLSKSLRGKSWENSLTRHNTETFRQPNWSVSHMMGS